MRSRVTEGSSCLLLAPPALGKGSRRGLACLRIAVCWRSIFMVTEGQRPHPSRTGRRRIGLEDAADDNAVGEHVKIVARQKWRDAPLTKKAPYQPSARMGPARFCAGGAQ
jgi:hypothetical protein